MTEHIEGRPVSATTYRRHGCRCDGCKVEHAATMRHQRAARDRALVRVQTYVNNELVKWAREHITEAEREAINERAYRDLGIERRRPGRRKARVN